MFFIDLLALHVELSCKQKIVAVFLELRVSRVLCALQISPSVACYARTHIMMLHSKFAQFGSLCRTLEAIDFLLINIHIEKYLKPLECGCGIFWRARFTHKAAKKEQVCLDRSCLRTLACILYEYEGQGTLISKTCIRFWRLHVHFTWLRFPSLHQNLRFQVRFHRIRVNERPKRRQMSVFCKRRQMSVFCLKRHHTKMPMFMVIYLKQYWEMAMQEA